MSTTPETSLPGPDRFARRQRNWQNVPGVPDGSPDGANSHEVVDERELRKTIVGEHLRANLRGTFFPDAIFQTTIVVLVIFAVLLVITFVMPPTVGAPAEPLNQELYLPRPAWYFYFLFQILEWMKGPIFVPIGTFFLPNIALIALILLPFYDRNPARKIWKRPLAILFFGGSILFIVVANLVNVVQAPPVPTQYNQNHAPTPLGQQSEIPGSYLVW